MDAKMSIGYKKMFLSEFWNSIFAFARNQWNLITESDQK